MNKIWCFLLIFSIIISLITGNINTLGDIMIASSMKAWNVFLQVGILILFWGGIFEIAVNSGLVKIISKWLKKPLHFIFKEIPTDSEAYELISSNIVANLLGLGSAATPIGLKAFKELQKLNQDKSIPTRSMITLLAINCSSITLVPTTIISMRNLNEGTTPLIVILLMMASTILSTIIALLLDSLFYHLSRLK